MIAIFSDTHSHRGHELHGEALGAAREAEVTIHAGDFTTVPALEAFRSVTRELYAVHGNADGPDVRARLPAELTLSVGGLTVAVTHRHDAGETGLAAFGRAAGADVVISGHTHWPSVTDAGDVLLINPGSHAQPRGARPGFATVEPDGDGFLGRISEPDGTLVESFAIPSVTND